MLLKIKKWFKFHKKGLTATFLLSLSTSTFFLGNAYGTNVIDFLSCSGDLLPWSISFYCIVALLLTISPILYYFLAYRKRKKKLDKTSISTNEAQSELIEMQKKIAQHQLKEIEKKEEKKV